MIKEKFKEKHIDITKDLQIVELNGKVKLDPFEIEYITLTHSILEPNGLKIQTPAGVVYTTNTATACYIVNVPTADITANRYVADDIITTSDGGKFQVIQVDSDNDNVYLTAELPLITGSSTLTNTTQNIPSLSINSVTNPEVKNSSGEVIYLDNRSPVTRSEDQVEQIKALIRF